KLAQITKMVEELERKPLVDREERRVYTPKFLTPDELIETVEAIRAASTPGTAAAAPKLMGAIGRGQPPPALGGQSPHENDEQFDMLPVGDTGSILIIGRRPGIAKAMELIQFADVDTPKSVRETVILKYRDPNDVVVLIQAMFPKLVSAAGGPQRQAQPFNP